MTLSSSRQHRFGSTRPSSPRLTFRLPTPSFARPLSRSLRALPCFGNTSFLVPRSSFLSSGSVRLAFAPPRRSCSSDSSPSAGSAECSERLLEQRAALVPWAAGRRRARWHAQLSPRRRRRLWLPPWKQDLMQRAISRISETRICGSRYSARSMAQVGGPQNSPALYARDPPAMVPHRHPVFGFNELLQLPLVLYSRTYSRRCFCRDFLGLVRVGGTVR